MEVYSIKEIQAYEFVSFTQFKAISDLDFCCEKFNKYVTNMDVWDRKIGKLNVASAGNRTRIYCLEGNNANLYTTDAEQPVKIIKTNKRLWYKG